MQISTPFAGRQKELDELHRSLDEAINYGGSMVLIRGETGVGKTRLLNQFAGEIEKRHLHILQSRAVRDDVRQFAPFVQVIEHYLCDIERHQSWLARFISPEIAPYLIYLIPELDNHYPLDMPQPTHPIDNRSFAYSFQRFFKDLSRSRPLVLLLDDIQWMSDESVELMKYFIHRVSELPALCVATWRDRIENAALQRTIDEFNAAQLVCNIHLENLTLSETEVYLNQRFECNLSDHFANWLFTMTSGNPLFIDEITKSLLRQNIIRHDPAGDRWQVEEDYREFRLSETVESVINYRMRILTAPELSLLRGASVIGERFSPEILHGLFDAMDNELFSKSIKSLMIAGMIAEVGNQMQFSHPLIRELLYRNMDIEERHALHRKVVRILDEGMGSSEEISFHMIRDLQPSENTEELACYLLDISMDMLSDSYNYPAVWEYLSTADRIADNTELNIRDRLKIKAELNHLSWIMGRDTLSFDESERLTDMLEANDLNREAALNCQLLFHGALITQDLIKAEEFLERGISLVDSSDSLYWILKVEHCLMQRRKGLLEESEKEAERLGKDIPQDTAPEALYRVISNLGLVSYLRGDIRKAHQFVSRARKIVEEQHLLLHTGRSLSNLGLLEMMTGNLDSAFAKFKDSIKEAELLQQKPIVGVDLLYIGYSFLYRGDYSRSIPYFDQACEISNQINNPRLIQTAQRGKAKALLRLDDIENAESMIRDMHEDEIPVVDCCDLLLVRSQLLLRKGDLEDAETVVDKLIELTERQHFEARYANALATKSLILLQKNQLEESLDCLDRSKSIFLSQGEKLHLSELLVNYGLGLGGEQGEAILMEGLAILFDIRATAKVQSLHREMKEKGFNEALKLIHDNMDVHAGGLTEISTFGGLSIKRPEEMKPVVKREWQSRKSQELLSLLLMQSDPLGSTREILASHLWPEATEKKSNTNLRVALTNLKRILGKSIILQDGQFLTLNRELVQVDFWIFNTLIEEWRSLKNCGKLHPAEDRASKAIALYTGAFLPEFYSTPVADKQCELENSLKELLLWLATRCIERVEWGEAVHYARRLLLLDSCNERACRIAMQGLYQQGNRTGAIRQYERFRKNLESEFNITPSDETIELHEKITATE